MKPKIDSGDFLEKINGAIAEGRHVGFLNGYLDDFKKYQDYFDNALTDQNPKNQIFTFKVTYLGKKPVWRIFEIADTQNFNQLAEAIIDSMNFDNDHMHGFSFPETRGKTTRLRPSIFEFFAPDWEDDQYPTFRSDEIKIEDVDYKKYPKLGFIFDYGDGHEFDVEMIEMRPINRHDDVDVLPKLVDIRGVAPEQYPEYDEGFDDLTIEDVASRRQEIENELVEMLKEYKSDFDLDYIKKIIWNSDDQDDLMKIVAVFDRGGGAGELENILDLALDAWNYFPHKDFGGKSPAELALLPE